MTFRAVRAAVLLAAGAAAAGCASTGPSAAPAARAAGARGKILVVQVLHRAARTAAGDLRTDAPFDLADAVAEQMTGREPALDSWLPLGGSGGRALVVAAPRTGPVARAVFERLRLVAEKPEYVRLVEDEGLAELGQRRVPVILVVTPGWEDGRVGADPLGAARELATRGLKPALVIADLTTPMVLGRAWTADEVVASRSPEAAALVVRFILEAHASGTIPAADRIAADLGLELARIDWARRAIFR